MKVLDEEERLLDLLHSSGFNDGFDNNGPGSSLLGVSWRDGRSCTVYVCSHNRFLRRFSYLFLRSWGLGIFDSKEDGGAMVV